MKNSHYTLLVGSLLFGVYYTRYGQLPPVPLAFEMVQAVVLFGILLQLEDND